MTERPPDITSMDADPALASSQYIIDGFPMLLANDVRRVVHHLGPRSHEGRHGDVVHVEGGSIQIPSRVYPGSDAMSRLQQLDGVEKMIGLCVLSRHHNGYQRERVIADLARNDAQWACAYLVKLLGEPVIEIHAAVADAVQRMFGDLDAIRAMNDVIMGNSGWWTLIQRRVVSYWAEYHRFDHPHTTSRSGRRCLPDSYPAARALRLLELLDGAPQLARPLRDS